MSRALGAVAISALALAATPAVALADPTPAIASALDRFQVACATALTDPEAYIASLTLPGPSGEDGLYPTGTDGALLVLTAQSEGVTDRVEIAEAGGLRLRRCSISAILPGFPETPEVVASLVPLLTERATAVTGGETRNVTPIWEPDNEPVVFEGDPLHIFHATGLLPGSDVVSTIQTQSGEVLMSASRTLAPGEAAQ